MKKLPLIILIIFFYTSTVYAHDFSALDDIVSKGISNNYFPGAQLLIGNENDILYQRSYGNFTYDEFSSVVATSSMFDLASLTKVVATTSAIMKLYSEYKIDLNDKVAKYIQEFANNGKDEVTILNLLLHNSGLKAFIPFYKYYNTKEQVLNAVNNAELDYQINTKFVYSDLNAILLGLIVEKVSGMNLDDYCKSNIFLPLEMNSTTFIPDDITKERILPTEYDNYWRNRQLKGEVHDEAASILGGVAGNAGLFSNSTDLYKFMRMMLNNGRYYYPNTQGLKEEILFNSEILDLFTRRFVDLSYINTRALGWDTKPEPASRYRIPCGELISDNCFGHTGYTGTSVWCDKDRNLIIIFLTNRVYPSRENNGIREVRPEIHNAAIELLTRQN